MNPVMNISLLAFGIILLAACPPLGVLMIFAAAGSTSARSAKIHAGRRVREQRQAVARQNQRRQAVRSLL